MTSIVRSSLRFVVGFGSVVAAASLSMSGLAFPRADVAYSPSRSETQQMAQPNAETKQSVKICTGATYAAVNYRGDRKSSNPGAVVSQDACRPDVGSDATATGSAQESAAVSVHHKGDNGN